MNTEVFPIALAEKIVIMLHNVTGKNVNFMNHEGVIIATMQPERLHTIHEGAKKIMKGEVYELAVSAETAQKLKGAVPGYNGAVVYKGEKIGCIGLSGDPEMMKPLQQLAAVIVREEYAKFLSAETKQNVLEKITGEIEEISVAMDQIATRSKENFSYSQHIEEMTDNAEKCLKDTDNILKAVQAIGNQTKMLGLNASIEAARAGVHGKGFAVVAEEMGKLSSHSVSSLKNINHILGEVQSSVTHIAAKTRNSTVIADKQSKALEYIRDRVTEIQYEMERLVENE
jgi:hypothetical protein